MNQNTGEGEGKELTLEELSSKISDLNQGIAKYRDTAQTATTVAEQARAEAATARAEAAAAKAEAEALRQEKGGKKTEDDKEVKLNPEDQKRLESWAKAQGFVTKAEMEAQRISVYQESAQNTESQAVAEFINRHPEYTNSDKWDLVKKEFEQYKQPTSITGYRTLLNKIHKDISSSEDRAAELRARDEQKQRLGLGGRGGKDESSEDSMTMERLRDKYPSLSEEQITSRLAEINDLAAARAKKIAARKT